MTCISYTFFLSDAVEFRRHHCVRRLFFFFPGGIRLHVLFLEFLLPFRCPGTWHCFTLLSTFLQSGLGWMTQHVSVLHVDAVPLLLTPFSQVRKEKWSQRLCGDAAGNSSFFGESSLVCCSEIHCNLLFYYSLLCLFQYFRMSWK